VAITGHLAGTLGALDAVTTTARLSLGSQPLAERSRTHRLDGVAPVADVVFKPGKVIGIGSQLIVGLADDGLGSGVATVEVSTNGGSSWQPASGTDAWNTTVTVSGATGAAFTLKTRATDRQGNVGIQTFVFTVDATPPTVSFTLPAAVYGAIVDVSGTTIDPAPTGGRVVKVEAQVDGTSSAWLPASGPYAPGAGGQQPWRFAWNAPDQDGVSHQLRFRATDGAGNVSSPTAWQSTIVYTRPRSDMQVTQTVAPTTVAAGSNVVYTVNVKNLGPFPGGVALTALMPTGVNATVVSVTQQGMSSVTPYTATSTSVTGRALLLPVNGTAKLIITIKAASGAPANTQLVNRGTATLLDPKAVDPVSANNTANATSTVYRTGRLGAEDGESVEPEAVVFTVVDSVYLPDVRR
jgi:uncharacterized repeat protein (TIGR01451 family)